MQINTITEFRSFINELDLYNEYTKNGLYDMYYKRSRDFYILDLEKRKVIETSQTFSLDSEYISHIEEFTFYELYIETFSNNSADTMVLIFKTLEDLKKVKQFIKNNFKFLKR